MAKNLAVGLLLCSLVTSFVSLFADTEAATTKSQSPVKSNSSQDLVSANSAKLPKPVLRLHTGYFCESHTTAHIRCEGQVTNISNRTLRNIKVDITLRDAQGQFAGTGFADVSPTVLEPGQSGRFTDYTKTRPGVSTYKVAFTVRGGRVEHMEE